MIPVLVIFSPLGMVATIFESSLVTLGMERKFTSILGVTISLIGAKTVFNPSPEAEPSLGTAGAGGWRSVVSKLEIA